MTRVRIGNFSGFLGDRTSALAELVESDEVDVVTGDYLSEVTMSILAKLRAKRPDSGYASTLISQIRPVLSTLAEGEIRIVVNAGGLNPLGLADEIRTLCAEAQLDLPVASVVGDDLLENLADDGLLLAPESSEPLALGEFVPLTANAYLGGWGIAQALRDGARIVICGRVADASLVVGAAAWWHGWAREDWNALAGALVAGHVIECGLQATGGNYSGFRSVDLTYPGFPIAHVDSSGNSVITKPRDSGGSVNVGTVTAQLMYEIQGRWYANADVVADLQSVQIAPDGPDKVALTGALGAPPPPTTKVALTGLGAWENSMLLGVTGLDFSAKRDLIEHTLKHQLDQTQIDELRVELLGSPAPDPQSQLEATGFIRLVVQSQDERAVGRNFSNILVQQALGSYPGRFSMSPPGAAKQLGTYRVGSVRIDKLQHAVIRADGKRHLIEAPSTTRPHIDEFDTPDGNRGGDSDQDLARFGELVDAPLGSIVLARSGDKGSNANVGLWVETERQWAWLQQWLTLDRLRELLPEADGLRVDRLELPNLLGVNFVVHDLLRGGAISSSRLDSQAKALGEFLRARRVQVPRSLVSDSTIIWEHK